MPDLKPDERNGKRGEEKKPPAAALFRPPGAVAPASSFGGAPLGVPSQAQLIVRGGWLTQALSRSVLGRALLIGGGRAAARTGVLGSPLVLGVLMGASLGVGAWGLSLLPALDSSQKIAFAWDTPPAKQSPSPRYENSLEQVWIANGAARVKEGAQAEAPSAPAEPEILSDETIEESQQKREEALVALIEAGRKEAGAAEDVEKPAMKISQGFRTAGPSSAASGAAAAGPAQSGASSTALPKGGSAGRSMRPVQSTRFGASGPGRPGLTAGSAMGQLRTARAFSQTAAGRSGTFAAETAAAPFDRGAGAQSIGGGAGVSEGGIGAGQAATPPSDEPIERPAAGEGGGSGRPDSGKNVTPWQNLVDIAKILLIAAAGLLLLSYLFGLSKEPTMLALSFFFGKAAALLGVAVAALGVMIIFKSKQIEQGMIFTVGGALIAMLGFMMDDPRKADGGAAAGKAGEPYVRTVDSQLQNGSNVSRTLGKPAAGGTPAADAAAGSPGLKSAAQPPVDGALPGQPGAHYIP